MSYEERQETMGLASKDKVKEILKIKDNLVILDVRAMDEIESSAKFQVDGAKWVHVPVMPGATEELEKRSSEVLPDKEANIVIHCRSGKRASFAKSALEKQGYKNVVNAGGYDDIAALVA